jgi:hypothetical protein
MPSCGDPPITTYNNKRRSSQTTDLTQPIERWRSINSTRKKQDNGLLATYVWSVCPQLCPFRDDCRLLYTRSVYRLWCTERIQIAERNKKKMLCRSKHQMDIQNHRVLKCRDGGLGVTLLCQWSCNCFFLLSIYNNQWSKQCSPPPTLCPLPSPLHFKPLCSQSCIAFCFWQS